MIAFKIIALLFIGYTLLNVWQRPGLFAAVVVDSFHYSTYFGPLGIATSMVGILVAFSLFADPRQPKIPIQKPEWFLIAWFLMSALSIVVSWQIDVSMKYDAQLVIYALANYGLGRSCGARPGFVRDLVIGSIASMLICEPGLLLSDQAVASRLAGDLSAVGASLMVDPPLVAIPAVLLFESTLTPIYRILLLLLLLFIVVPVGISLGTRGVFVGGGITIAILMAYRAWFGGVGKYLVWLGGIVSVGGVALAASWDFLAQTAIGLALSGGMGRLFMNFAGGQLVADSSSMDRVRVFNQAFEMIMNAPLFGHGIGYFAYQADQTTGYPHNTLIEILVSTGLVGFVLFLAGVVPLTIRALKAAAVKPLNWESVTALAFFIDIFVRMQLSLSLSMGKILFLTLGMIVARTSAALMTEQPTPGDVAPDAPGEAVPA